MNVDKAISTIASGSRSPIGGAAVDERGGRTADFDLLVDDLRADVAHDLLRGVRVARRPTGTRIRSSAVIFALAGWAGDALAALVGADRRNDADHIVHQRHRAARSLSASGRRCGSTT